MLTLTRQDKDEKNEVSVFLDSYQLINGNRCYRMRTIIVSESGQMELHVIAGPKTLIILRAKMRERNPYLRSFVEYLDSRGIDKGVISSLFSFCRKTNSDRIDF